MREAGDFVIIDNYKDEELQSLGVQEEIISNRNTLKLYDEAIVIREE